jgi:phosphoribosyl 1,2-cyclic phosphodiesterase
MQIRFYGVRGSIPTPGPATASFGGNTSCVHLRLADGTDFVFDAGTGIRGLGNDLAAQRTPIHLLLTHSHFDHIQGFPFFSPLRDPDREIHVCQGQVADPLQQFGILEQLNGHNFPVTLEGLPARIGYVPDPEAFFARREFRVRRQALNHPGGGMAYRIDADGCSIAFVTDNELDPPEAPATSWGEWVAFCEGVDVLVHDAQYIEQDLPGKHGWGHSLVSQVRRLGHDAGVGCIVLYHHDPDRTDAEVDMILRESEAWFAARGSRTACLCAWEGLVLEVGRDARGQTRLAINQTRPFALAHPMTANLRTT